MSGLLLSGSTLFGTTEYGGQYTGFQVNTDGTGYSELFGGNSGSLVPLGAGLLLNGNILYGTSGNFLFQAFTDATNYAKFTGQSLVGSSRFILSGSTLYGTASTSGSKGLGLVFKINTDDSGYTVLHNFTNAPDGNSPQAALVLAGGMLYGTTFYGGALGYGTVFALSTNGTGYTVLYNFTNTPDGANPSASLVSNGSQLYGITQNGGSTGAGTLFAIGTNGAGYTLLKNFAGTPDGATPEAGLFLLQNKLYGTTSSGGASNNGTVFQINTDGTGYAIMHKFLGAPIDGANPLGNIIVGSGGLYGTTSRGNANGYQNDGTIFRLTLPPPPLQVAAAAGSPVVFWPNDGFTHTLQTTTNLNSGTWTTVSNAAPVIGLQITNVNGQGGAFYRLQ